ncbi:MAG: ABC transporter ATP-binding protein [Thermoplasmata archaeon]|nr:ABC transporter ATP-binding protein [Thermoplasmata archaeon]
MSSSELLHVDRLSASWGKVPVLHAITFSIARAEHVTLLGPNGSGKSTLLRCLAGLEPVTGGTIELSGRSLAQVAPQRRGIGMLFQEPALFPRRTVAENIAYGLEIAHRSLGEREERVDELVALLHLEGLEDRMPDALSGGERQRVALARTLAPRPPLVLLDEPFASVDAELRAELTAVFGAALRSSSTASLHVTHDREEAFFLGERVLVLQSGRLEQSGRPADVFRSPANARVARFLGFNVLPGPDGEVAVHPSSVQLVPSAVGQLTAVVVAVGLTGPERLIHMRAEGGRRVEVRGSTGGPAPKVGDLVGLDWPATAPLPA